MKKVLLSLVILISMVLPSQAAQKYDPASRVQTVGQNLMVKSGIPANGVKFMVVSGGVNNSNYVENKVVNVASEELAFAGNDNEVAAIVGNELGHIISGHASKGKVINLLQVATNTSVAVDPNSTSAYLAQNYKTSKQDMFADVIAVDLMVNAGYNPLAIIVTLTKQTGTYWEVIQGKPANAERAMNVFNYVSYAFPAKVRAGYGCNEYRSFLTYANAQVELRKANKKQESKNLKAQAKAKSKVISLIAKFKMRGGMSGWDAAYGLLQAS